LERAGYISSACCRTPARGSVQLIPPGGSLKAGYLDVLYRKSSDSASWEIVDFKTDTVQSEVELDLLVDRYSRQLRSYPRAVERLLGPVDGARICFLDDRGEITLVGTYEP